MTYRAGYSEHRKTEAQKTAFVEFSNNADRKDIYEALKELTGEARDKLDAAIYALEQEQAHKSGPILPFIGHKRGL